MIARFAGITVEFCSRFDFMESFCSQYLAPQGATPDLRLSVSEEELQAQKEEFLRAYPHLMGKQLPLPYLESVCFYRALAYSLYAYDAFLLHACAVDVDGRGYAFAAKSGTGKSTHAYLWKQLFGERFSFINGDKPILRLEGGKPYVYGTPYAGKEGEQTPTKSPLTAIAVLVRDSYDHIEPISADEAFFALMHQVLHPTEPQAMQKSLELLKQTVLSCDCYRLYCTPNLSAAQLAFETMSKQR